MLLAPSNLNIWSRLWVKVSVPCVLQGALGRKKQLKAISYGWLALFLNQSTFVIRVYLSLYQDGKRPMQKQRLNISQNFFRCFKCHHYAHSEDFYPQGDNIGYADNPPHFLHLSQWNLQKNSGNYWLSMYILKMNNDNNFISID